MDSNQGNQGYSVESSQSTVLKTEAVKEELEDNESSVNGKETDTDHNPNNLPSNGQKRKSSEDSPQEAVCSDNTISIKRRRYSDTQVENPEPNTSLEEGLRFTLIVGNGGGDWTSQQVLDYIQDTCGVLISKVSDSREGSDSDFQIKLKFGSKDQLDEVREKLREKEVEGKITTEIENQMVEQEADSKDGCESVDSNVTVRQEERESQSTESLPRQDQGNDTDSSDFNIKEDYLRSLGITPPITNWINVTNFRCDKSELKEVLGLAGRVVICSVVSTAQKYANAMYSHPLEAVQAVSMLNGQMLYGQKLAVSINNFPNVRNLLPKGLAGVGPGIGKFGKPVQDIPDQYKKFIRGENSAIDANLFQGDLNRSGVTLNPDANYLRTADTPYIQTTQDDLSGNSADSSVPQTSHIDDSQLDRVEQKSISFFNTPVSDFSAQSSSPNVNNNGINSRVLKSRDSRLNQSFNCPSITKDRKADRLVISSAVISGQHAVSSQIRGQGPISGSGRILAINNSNPLSGSTLINFTSPRSGSGSVSGSNVMSGLRPMPAPVSISGPVSISVSGPLSGPGPRLAPVLMTRPISIPGSMSGPGPIPGPVRMQGPGHLSSGLSPIAGTCPRPMIGQGAPSGPMLRGPGPNQMVHISIGPRMPLPTNRFSTPMSPMSRPIAPSGPVQNQMTSNGSRISGTNIQMFRADPVTIQLTNLPSNTNFLSLGHKLSELGHVVYLEFTTPGCAVVRFANPADAERCFQNFRNILG